MEIKVGEAIKAFEGGVALQEMVEGQRYYDFENTAIMKRKKLMYARNQQTGQDYLIEDPYKANNKLASGYYKLLVDQKVQYILGKSPNIRTIDAVAKVAAETGPGVASASIDVDKLLGRDFLRVLRRCAKDAAMKCIGWAQPYVDQAGAFRLMRIPPEQCIPVYDEADADLLLSVIRFYPVTVNGKDGRPVSGVRAEVWTAQDVTVYLRVEGEQDFAVEQPTRPHMTQSVTYGQRVEEQTGRSWGRVPLVPLYNNDDRHSDLKGVRRYIDAYDAVESDFANNLADIQDVFWVLKGYDGQNMNTFLDEVRKYKTLKVSEEGDARAETVQIPTEARQALLDRLNDDIFKFGRGMDPSKTGDGNITNIVIKARYSNLDLKASEFEAQLDDFVAVLVDFLNIYLGLYGKQPVPEYEVVFNRSQIINETELLGANAGQQGSISEETRLSHHPWVDDVFSEQKRLQNEKPDIDLTPPSLDDGAGEAGDGGVVT